MPAPKTTPQLMSCSADNRGRGTASGIIGTRDGEEDGVDTLRIERMAVLHGNPRGSPGLGQVRQRAGPHPDPQSPPAPRAEREQRELTPSHFNDTAVRFSYNKEIGRVVMQIVDKSSAAVVKQLPSEEMVAFLRRFRTAVALLVDTTA